MQRRGPTSVLLPLPLPLLLALLLGAGKCQKLERALLRPVKDEGLREPVGGGTGHPLGSDQRLHGLSFQVGREHLAGRLQGSNRMHLGAEISTEDSARGSQPSTHLLPPQPPLLHWRQDPPRKR